MSMRFSSFNTIFMIWILGSFVTLNAQSSMQKKVYRDSLLNELMNIEKRSKDISKKDTSKGYVLRHLPDSIFPEEKVYPKSDLELLYNRNSNGLLIVPQRWIAFDNDISFIDTVIFDPSFLPVMFDGKLLPDNLDLYTKNYKSDAHQPYHLLNPDQTFASSLDKLNDIEQIRQYYFQNFPDRIATNALDFKNKPAISEAIVEKKNIFEDLLSTDDVIDIYKPEIESFKIKSKSWLADGEHTIQISQNKFSHNWAGANNFNIFAYNKLNINYKKNKISFRNLLEWRVNIQQNDADEVHNITVTDDLFRTYSTFSIDAPIKKWSYSSNLEMKSPMLNRYKINSEVKTRAFLSPFELNLGLGVRYNLEKTYKNKYRKLRISADLSLLSLYYRSVEDGKVDVSPFGIEKDKWSKTDYGSTYNFTINYDRNRFTSFSSRLKYFTNYEKVYVECENTANFTLNRYFSTTLYLYLKFDDGVSLKNKDRDLGYFMYNEMLRFGLTYKW